MAKAVETTVDIKDIVLSNASFGPQEIRAINNAIARDCGQFAVLRGSTAELEGRGDQTPASAVRLGVCYYLLGRV